MPRVLVVDDAANIRELVSLYFTAQQLGAATPGATAAAAGGSAAISGAGPSASKLVGMKRQLDAMQKEIDSLSLPSDDDFSDAANAVY